MLDTEFEKFRLSDPYTIGTYDDVEKDEYWMFLEAKETPNEIGLIGGDFVSCLRTSLDYLGKALMIVGAGTPSDRASFPVIGGAIKFGSMSYRFVSTEIGAIGLPELKKPMPVNLF